MATANYLEFLEALDGYTRSIPLGAVTHASDLHSIAADAGLAVAGDYPAARWTGQLVELGYVRCGSHGGDARPAPPRGPWSMNDLQRFIDFVVTQSGREEAERIRRLKREQTADVVLGRAMPSLRERWLTDQQRAGLNRPLRDLEAALTSERAPAAIGAAKELVEAACKVTLECVGQKPAKTASLSSLFTAARRALDADDGGIGRSLSATVHGLDALRNEAAAGHGTATASPAEMGEALLAASAATGLLAFLLGAVAERRQATNQAAAG